MINDERPLQQFRYPAMPRWWVWPGLLVLCLAINLAWSLLHYANATDRNVSSWTFWTHALGYGFMAGCTLIASVLAGFSLMTIRVTKQNRILALRHDWQQRRMQEGAAVCHSVLLGPACLSRADRQQLVQDAPTHPHPTEMLGEWRLPDLAAPDSEMSTREAQLAASLANRLVSSWPSPATPQAVAWAGSSTAWHAFSATLQQQGIACPAIAHPLPDIEALDFWIDQLHDEAAPLALIMLAGIHIPPTAEDGTTAMCPCEAGFAVCLQATAAASTMLHRPVQTHGSADLRRAQRNARQEKAPAFIQLYPQHLAYAAEAEWAATPLQLQAYWGDVGPLVPWILLLSALDRAEQSGQPLGWHIQQEDQAWAGVVLPATIPQQGAAT